MTVSAVLTRTTTLQGKFQPYRWWEGSENTLPRPPREVVVEAGEHPVNSASAWWGPAEEGHPSWFSLAGNLAGSLPAALPCSSLSTCGRISRSRVATRKMALAVTENTVKTRGKEAASPSSLQCVLPNTIQMAFKSWNSSLTGLWVAAKVRSTRAKIPETRPDLLCHSKLRHTKKTHMQNVALGIAAGTTPRQLRSKVSALHTRNLP